MGENLYPQNNPHCRLFYAHSGNVDSVITVDKQSVDERRPDICYVSSSHSDEDISGFAMCTHILLNF